MWLDGSWMVVGKGNAGGGGGSWYSVVGTGS